MIELQILPFEVGILVVLLLPDSQEEIIVTVTGIISCGLEFMRYNAGSRKFVGGFFCDVAIRCESDEEKFLASF